jgi:Flp pilus assembly protein TadD
MLRKAKVILGLAGWLAAGTPAAWASGWGVLEGGGFIVYTDAGEAEARRVAAGLAEMAEAMEAVWGPLPEFAPPARVYVFEDMAGLRAMGARGFSKGFYQSGPDFDVIAVLGGEADTVRSARHEYVHRVLHRTSRRVPAWMEEGLAEMYSTLVRDGERWLVGMPVASHVEALRRIAWVELDELARMPEDPRTWDRAEGVMRYYGQSWAVVHFLAVGPERFVGLLKRLQAGEEVEAALKEEFGMGGAAVIAEARARVMSGRMVVRRLEAGAGRRSSPVGKWRTVGEEEMGMALAELSVATGQRASGEEYLRTLRRAAQGSARAKVGVGLLALRKGAKSEAEAQFREAVAEGVEEPAAWFELAMLVRDREGGTPEVRRVLERAVELNPAHGEALYLLAMEEQKAGRGEEAAGLLERAVTALPRQFVFREALARVYAELGRGREARAQADAALVAARTGNEREMAEGLLKELEAAARPVALDGKKPEVTVPRGWLEPERDGEVRGVLVRVECANPVVFEVDTGDGVRRFHANPARLMVTGRPQETVFQCGEQKERARVAARYRGADLLVQLVFLEGQ